MNLNKRVEQSRISEKDYRKLPVLSYSNIKLYDQDREKFFKQMILGEVPREKKSNALILGDLVHTLLSGLDNAFDIKFHIASATKPSGQMGELCEALLIRSLQSLNEFDEQQDSFKIIFSDAVNKVKYDYEGNEVAFKKKDEAKILEMFEGSDGEMWYKEALETKNKTLVSVPMIEQAERLVQKLKENSNLSRYMESSDVWLDEVKEIKAVDIINELPIEFELNEVKYKCMPDRLFVNHINQCIEILDWKCASWDNEEPDSNYLRFGYYIQAALYHLGVREWANKHDMKHYSVEPMKFIFIDTNAFNEPVILTLSHDDIDRAMRGFKIRSYRYRGVRELMENIEWHLSTGIWNTTKNLYNNKGILKLNLPYGSR